ncbi:hypothetical protein [Nodosilinea nodulosa]|uniref:hypothetical protein n=1 Tax=Nodosilinea nodulosa TaxID=416001 RepID=UPI0002FC0B70|nr:hypothetical protein [Nodosilinea nodulosa]
MVIVIPLEATDRLVSVAETHGLSLPVPLSSGCASYLSAEEMDTILTLLIPLSADDAAVAALIDDLKAYQAQAKPVIPCDPR